VDERRPGASRGLQGRGSRWWWWKSTAHDGRVETTWRDTSSGRVGQGQRLSGPEEGSGMAAVEGVGGQWQRVAESGGRRACCGTLRKTFWEETGGRQAETRTCCTRRQFEPVAHGNRRSSALAISLLAVNRRGSRRKWWRGHGGLASPSSLVDSGGRRSSLAQRCPGPLVTDIARCRQHRRDEPPVPASDSESVRPQILRHGQTGSTRREPALGVSPAYHGSPFVPAAQGFSARSPSWGHTVILSATGLHFA